ncbi:MAG TPA: penicillin-binding protein 2 [Candidatus Limnocylindrales bacterium]|nr:penicillin-binding protein 2 [Candidatus Limnocylindrales bacterium]
MLGRTDSRGRLLFLLIAFVIAAGALVARLGWWQIARRDDLAAAAHRQIYLRAEVPAQRGAIYDRSGTIILAQTVTRHRLVADPKRLGSEQREALIAILADELGLDEAARATVAGRLAADRSYVVVLRDLVPEASEAIRARVTAARIPAVAFESESVRVYPQSGGGPETSLAAHLLGFVNREGTGQYGIEQHYQELLAGTPAIVESDRDANGRPVIETQHTVDAGVAGADLSLTVDAGLQLALEQEVMSAWVADRAKSVSAVVIDPYTGAILAEATYPSYDANDYASVAATDPGRFIDPVVAEVYEPGSVFKMLTVVAGLETGTVAMDTEIDDVGTLRLDGGRTKIDDADRRAMGVMSFEDAIAWSRNVVAAKVALGLAPTLDAASTVLFDTWRRLGFGTRTGVDIAGEVGGILNDPGSTPWREIDIANGSFGQGVAVTPLQLAVAYAAMVNGGTLVTPHVVGAIDGTPTTVAARGTVLDPALSPDLVQLMHHVVATVPFYRDRTLIPGYFVGGKTGTAQIWDTDIGNWKTGVFNFSFIGYVGRQTGRPDLVIAVRINEGTPNVRRVGQLEMPVMSFELFRRIATDAVSIPGLLPELPVQEVPVAKVHG